MAREFKLPDPGEGIHEAEIIEVLVEEGDEVEEGQDVLLVETDKATLELPASESGVIEKIHVSAGDIANVGDVLITFSNSEQSDNDENGEPDREEEAEQPAEKPLGEEETNGSEESEDVEDQPDKKQASNDRSSAQDEEESNAAKEESGLDEDDRKIEGNKSDRDDEAAEADESKDDKATNRSESMPDSEEATSEKRRKKASEDEDPEHNVDADSGKADETVESHSTERGPVKSVPATRKLARELGVDLHTVTPSGPHGRITDADVRKAAENDDKSHQPSSSLPNFEQWGETEREPLRSIRRATANRTATAWKQIPHVTHIDAVAIDILEAFRQRHKDDAAEDGSDLTLTAFVVKAVVAALKDHPRFNASIDTQRKEIVYKHYHNIGVAVDTDRGLLVPVLRDADSKSVLDIAAELSELAERTREGDVSKEDLSGGTFTITNVGPLGGRAFTPIVNWPEAAILGLGEARYEPSAEHSATGAVEFVPQLMLPLCLGFDHRVNDGADAARFMATFMKTLADPDRFILAT